jgi:pimeloyl-ACP methyl ester carboxylesterase
MAEMVPEGQEGLLTFFLRRGFGVFAITWIGQKRSGYSPQARKWMNQDGYNVLYDKNAQAIAELLDLIGPAIIIGKSQGGPNSYRVLDLRPQFVKGAILIAPGQVGGTAPTNYPQLRPLLYNEETGDFSLFYPFERRKWTPEGEPDFTHDFLTSAERGRWASGGASGSELWEAYRQTPEGKSDNSQPPSGGLFGSSEKTAGLTKIPLTPVGSPDRPTKDVTFTNSKILIITGEEDQDKGLDWNTAFVAAMKRAGVKDVESIEMTRYNGFPHEDHYAELGQNVERIGFVLMDWLVRKGLAVDVPSTMP